MMNKYKRLRRRTLRAAKKYSVDDQRTRAAFNIELATIIDAVPLVTVVRYPNSVSLTLKICTSYWLKPYRKLMKVYDCVLVDSEQNT